MGFRLRRRNTGGKRMSTAISRGCLYVRTATVALFLMVLCSAPLLAAETPFPESPLPQLNWQAAWGTVDLGSSDDPVIPASNHDIKLSIKNTLKTCVTAAAGSADFRVYSADLNGDGLNDYVVDVSSLEGKLTSDCPETICNQNGCFLVVYYANTPSQIIVESPQKTNDGSSAQNNNKDNASGKDQTTPDACPASAAKNTECRPECQADYKICPGLFKYTFNVGMALRTTDWHAHEAKYFPPSAQAIPSPYKSKNDQRVISLILPASSCYAQEVTFNNGLCRKYYQSSGIVMTDLFELYKPPVASDNATRYSFYPFSHDLSVINSRGELFGGGQGVRLEAVGTDRSFFALQVEDFDHDGSAATPGEFFCHQFTNTVSENFFLPVNTDEELRALVLNTPPHIISADCDRRYSEWTGGPFISNDKTAGVLDCSQIYDVPCHAEVEVFAARNCERSTGAVADCQECADLGVTEPANSSNAYMSSADTWQRYQTVMNLIRQNATELAAYDAAIQNTMNGTPPISFWGEASGMRLFFRDRYHYGVGCSAGASLCEQLRIAVDAMFATSNAIMYSVASNACTKRQLCHLNVGACSHSISCFPPATKILMANGTTKPISKIRIGDAIKGFLLNAKTNALVVGTVKAIKVTHDQPVIQINGLKLTPSHPLKLADGRIVLAGAITQGDVLLDAKGKKQPLRMIVREKDASTVFNLDIEGADGFIADGLRVLDESMRK